MLIEYENGVLKYLIRINAMIPYFSFIIWQISKHESRLPFQSTQLLKSNRMLHI